MASPSLATAATQAVEPTSLVDGDDMDDAIVRHSPDVDSLHYAQPITSNKPSSSFVATPSATPVAESTASYDETGEAVFYPDPLDQTTAAPFEESGLDTADYGNSSTDFPTAEELAYSNGFGEDVEGTDTALPVDGSNYDEVAGPNFEAQVPDDDPSAPPEFATDNASSHVLALVSSDEGLVGDSINGPSSEEVFAEAEDEHPDGVSAFSGEEAPPEQESHDLTADDYPPNPHAEVSEHVEVNEDPDVEYESTHDVGNEQILGEEDFDEGGAETVYYVGDGDDEDEEGSIVLHVRDDVDEEEVEHWDDTASREQYNEEVDYADGGEVDEHWGNEEEQSYSSGGGHISFEVQADENGVEYNVGSLLQEASGATSPAVSIAPVPCSLDYGGVVFWIFGKDGGDGNGGNNKNEDSAPEGGGSGVDDSSTNQDLIFGQAEDFYLFAAPLTTFITELKLTFDIDVDVSIDLPQLNLFFPESSIHAKDMSLYQLTELLKALEAHKLQSTKGQLSEPGAFEALKIVLIESKSSFHRQMEYLRSVHLLAHPEADVQNDTVGTATVVHEHDDGTPFDPADAVEVPADAVGWSDDPEIVASYSEVQQAGDEVAAEPSETAHPEQDDGVRGEKRKTPVIEHDKQDWPDEDDAATKKVRQE
ncbi:hypothetical protein DFJ73DRAFT_822910 [Zopfochytrium polystomum]|nr:hypothetical protein DFJ73DRAFT_822910 [Zopfochytrium polystomum]